MDAGIILPSGAASMRDCQVFVDSGMTNPKSNNHSSAQEPSDESNQTESTIQCSRRGY